MATKIERFKAGTYQKGLKYQFFVPERINQQWYWDDPQLNILLERASIRLGELNSFARLVPNIDLFIHLHVTKEAVISSRIEGTQTNIDEALMRKEDILPDRRDDWQEVQNYTRALNYAVQQLESLPLSSRLLCKTHEILLQGVRGEQKLPGQYRTSQNWIGGISISDAIFVPPAHVHVHELMGDLEKFLHNEDIAVPALVRAGIAHYQFETIHPFLDGNGRIGRLLITLYLVSEKVLDKPLLYLSAFFEKNKSLYYDNLMRVREKNDLLHWLRYFLVGIEETANQAVSTLSQVIRLKESLEQHIQNNFGRKMQSASKLLKYLFEEPIVKVKDVELTCELSTKAANDLVQDFVKSDILEEASGLSRNRIFVFRRYVNLFR